MDSTPGQVTKPVKIISPKKNFHYSIGPRGWLFFFLAVLVLFLGFLGYLEYDRIVKPYFKEYICCLPAVLLAGLLFFLGFATRVTAIRQVRVQRPVTGYQQRSNMGSLNQLAEKPGESDFEPSQNLGGGSLASDGDNGLSRASDQTQIRGLKKYEPMGATKTELVSQKRNLVEFLKNLDEQYKDGLLMENVYIGLKNKYNRELLGLNNRLKSMAKSNTKKLRTMKIKNIKK